MKFTIKYTYEKTYSNPFVANAWEGDIYIDCKVSEVSFEEAKQKLVKQLETVYIPNLKQAPQTPQSEEIEICI